LSASYDNVAEAAGRAFGLDKLKKIDEEIKATDDLIAKQEEYIEAISADLPKDKAIMEAYYDKIIGGPTIEFDASGNIANYDAIQDAMYAKYNEMAS
jgi:phage FluMu gp28-like protein